RLRRGDATILYLIAYSAGRFWVEMFRPDAWVIGQLATAQWIALIIVVGGIVALIVRHAGWSWQEHPEESLLHMSALAEVNDEADDEPNTVDARAAGYAADEGTVQAPDSVARPDQPGS